MRSRNLRLNSPTLSFLNWSLCPTSVKEGRPRSRVCTGLDWPLPAARKTRQVSESNARETREDAGQRHRPSGAGIPGTLPTRMGSYGRWIGTHFFQSPEVGSLEPQIGSKLRTAARAETTGYARAFRHAVDSQPRGRLR